MSKEVNPLSEITVREWVRLFCMLGACILVLMLCLGNFSDDTQGWLLAIFMGLCTVGLATIFIPV